MYWSQVHTPIRKYVALHDQSAMLAQSLDERDIPYRTVLGTVVIADLDSPSGGSRVALRADTDLDIKAVLVTDN